MLKFSMTRIALAVPTLLAVLTLIFVIVRIAPGDPATAMLGDYASKEAVQQLQKQMGLDQPLWRQYVDYVSGVVHGDLGKSLSTRQPAWSQIRFVLPYSLELAFASIVLSIAMGIPLGVLIAVKRNGPIDYAGRVLSLAGLSFPAFYLGILLLYFLSLKLGLFPTTGAGSWSDPGSNLHHLALPAFTLALIEAAYVTRMTRSVMLNVLNDDYVRTARAKGLTEWVVLARHALRPALIPIVSLLGISAISLIGASVLTETVFNRPGLGKLMVGAVLKRDYTLLQAIMVVYAVIIVVINLIIDLTYGLVDPRVRVR
jgi:peptide/nickel transport system permease protein